jgi:uncharacterized membrane protein
MRPSVITSEARPEVETSEIRFDFFRFHARHLRSKEEAFVCFFGRPVFFIIQIVIVAIWVFVNVVGLAHFDVYPFILLDLAFSLQAAYAAPLILLPQTRQADRDKILTSDWNSWCARYTRK